MPIVSGGSGGSGGGALTLLTSPVPLAADGVFDVSGISQSYNDLVMMLIARGTRAGAATDFLQVRINNDSTANYDSALTIGSTPTQTFGSTSARMSGWLACGTATAGDFSMYEFVFPGYTSTTWNKAFSCRNAAPVTTGSAIEVEIAAGTWHSTAAITEVSFFGGTTANLLAGSSLRIYGRL